MPPALVNAITHTITFLIGMYLNRLFENRSRLITHYSHIGAGQVRINAQSPQININTRPIAIRNTGRISTQMLRFCLHKKNDPQKCNFIPS